VKGGGGNTYDTPCTLNTELYTERVGGETAGTVEENPEGGEYADKEDEDTKEGMK
jgi:hypothetical protein